MSAQVVVFHYDSGSTPGRQRLIYFADGPDNAGIDMEDGSFKRFTKRHMRNYRGANGGIVIELNKLPKSLSVNALVGGYKAENKLVYHDTRNNVLAVADPVRVNPRMAYDTFDGGALVVTGPGGTVRIRKYRWGKEVMLDDVLCTPEKLLKELQRVING